MASGQQILKYRLQKGLTQEELAERSGVSLRTIQRLEKDASTPRLYTLKVLAETLEVELPQLQAVEQEAQAGVVSDQLLLARLLNLSALSVLILPFGNILVPAIILFVNRRKKRFYQIGKRIFCFQILWTISLVLLLLVAAVSQGFLLKISGFDRFPIILYTALAAILFNVIVILFNAIRLKRGQTRVYRYTPVLF